MPCVVQRLEIPDVLLIEPEVFKDGRGFFFEFFKTSEFAAMGIVGVFVQANQSRSSRGVLRGLHYQLDPMAQGKLVRCLRGEIVDVAVDIRQGSPFFGKTVCQRISDENKRLIYIPPGFAHGFCVISEVAEIEYFCTKEYVPQLERGIIWNDPSLAIAWPVTAPLVSAKDSVLPRLKDADNYFFYTPQSS